MGAATMGAYRPRRSFNANELLAKLNQRNIERVLVDPHFPHWPDKMRGVPNGVLRSALFGAIKRGKRRYMEREDIPSVNGVSIIYTGPRLDQSDLDVWEGALHLARPIQLGDAVEFTERGLLRLIGRGGLNGKNIGKSDREWLRTVLARLKATAVEIAQGPDTYMGSLIDDCFRESSSGRCLLFVNPSMKVLFGRNGWTRIDWGIRHALIGHPLAQWLHGFYSTHAEPLAYKVETLHRLCGSEAGEKATTDAERCKALLDWVRDSLMPALALLEAVSKQAGQPFSSVIGGNGLVSVSRAPSPSQQRHLSSVGQRANSAPENCSGGQSPNVRGDRARSWGIAPER
ncbi:plasmid replication initiator TrfA [Paraburkholderia strydomiana]|uniref:plasmid replication initiator TrfA n=1 Tax=Paraburkholderia strydomiana TaxID=1245417 RepID=UPI001BE9B34D|nr:plasmid replication initiator TrfA [Paraburkholderia strydomiana]MBT2791829.1 Replication initiator protein A [Paraburkholderia strydomiana]